MSCSAFMLFGGDYIHILAVGKDDDSTVLVGAVGGDTVVLQAVENVGVGVAVIVVFATADEGIFGIEGIKESL